MIYRVALKRGMDILVGGLALICLAPGLLLLALAVKCEDGGPALFRQIRVGRHGRKFALHKFRSMPVGSGDVPSAEAGALGVTRVGRFLRHTNLDELPQFYDILLGRMSLVGPRPALACQANLLRLREANGAARVRPGLTGLAQVSSYDGMPEEEKARLDGAYATSISFLGDAAIVLRTFTYLTRRPPVY